MELYVLNDLLQPETVLDRFESLIWTERFRQYGDFELVTESTPQTRTYLAEGTLLAMNRSNRVMVVETAEDALESDGSPVFNVSGRSLEATLAQRTTRKTNLVTGGVVSEDWSITDTPGNITRAIFDAICRNNTAIPQDNIPFLNPGSMYPPSTIPEPTENITVNIGKGSLYDATEKLVNAYGLGFRLTRDPSTSRLFYDVYSGNDRTTGQSAFTPVIFSPNLENMTSVTQLRSIENYYNVAYVTAKNGSLIVYAAEASEYTSGFERRVMMVDAMDVTLPAGPALVTALTQRGQEALAAQKMLEAVDGEVSEGDAFRYDIDYTLGDLVEIQTSSGATQRMRITEQIFIDDAEGERGYPTLESEMFITPGSWFAWDFNQVWDEASGSWYDH